MCGKWPSRKNFHLALAKFGRERPAKRHYIEVWRACFIKSREGIEKRRKNKKQHDIGPAGVQNISCVCAVKKQRSSCSKLKASSTKSAPPLILMLLLSTQRVPVFSVRTRGSQGFHPWVLHGPLCAVWVGTSPWTGLRLWRRRSLLHTRHSRLLPSENGRRENNFGWEIDGVTAIRAPSRGQGIWISHIWSKELRNKGEGGDSTQH